MKKKIIIALLLSVLGSQAALASNTELNLEQQSVQKSKAPRLALQQKAKGQQPAPQARVQQQQLQIPSGEAMLIMIRSSLSALSQANLTNNYSVLNSLGSDNFRAANSPVKLSETFAAFRANNIDLAPVLLINPQLSNPPQIVDGRLRLLGAFPSQPMQVNFDLTYEPSQQGWKLYGLAVNLSRTPAAPAALPQKQPATR